MLTVRTGQGAPRFPGVAIDWQRVGLVTLFGLVGLYRLAFILTHGSPLFSEPVVDVEASRTWLAGGDPWRVVVLGDLSFAGPPTMLLPYAPFALLEPAVGRVTLTVIAIGAALVAIRRLGLPMWWILWPPLFEAVIHASFDALIPLLFIVGGGPLAAFVKLYAAAALNPRGLLATGLLLVVTIPILPWTTFLADLPMIGAHLQAQAGGGLSSWGNPLAMVVVGVALLSTWPKSRVAAPAGLWPYAQLHYGAMALPLAASSPILAAFMSAPVPGAAPAGIIVYALMQRFRGTDRR